MKGKLIVFEGLDGSGKNTQSGIAFDKLKSSGAQVMKVSFPNYESPSGQLIKMYLSGKFGRSADSVNPYAASSLYAADRFASYKTVWEQHYLAGGVVIADRYTTSNAIHQCSKLPEDKWDSFLEWLFDYEYGKIAIPAPDRVIYLRVDPDISQELMSGRYNSDESRKDIHERDLEYLRRSRLAADYCAEKLGWLTVECAGPQGMRTIEDIAADVEKLLG